MPAPTALRVPWKHRTGWRAGVTDLGVGVATPDPEMVQAILAASPEGYWKLNEATGTTAADSSGNGRDGTYNSTYTLGAYTGADGDSYVDLGSGSGGQITIADDNVWTPTSGMSIVALVRPEAAELAGTTRRFIVSKGAASNYEWGLAISQGTAGRLRHDWWTSAGNSFSNEYFDGAFTADTWTLLIVRSAAPTLGQRFDLFADSDTALASSTDTTSGSGITNGTASVRIGWRADGPSGQYWHGGMAHVAIFTGQLSNAEVTAIVDGAVADGWI